MQLFSLCLSLCLCLFVCLCLSVCLSLCLSLFLSVCLSVSLSLLRKWIRQATRLQQHQQQQRKQRKWKRSQSGTSHSTSEPAWSQAVGTCAREASLSVHHSLLTCAARPKPRMETNSLRVESGSSVNCWWMKVINITNTARWSPPSLKWCKEISGRKKTKWK